MSVLELQDLAVSYRALPVLHGVSLHVARGECLGLVGESGCGKSTIALAAMRALPRGGKVTGGRISIDGQDSLTLGVSAMRALWARKISMVYQDPSRALNPTLSIAAQMHESFRVLGMTGGAARTASEAALRRVRIADPGRILQVYPHQLSGGMQQRVVIAMALAKNPALLVLDEPTTGLDATVEADILDTIDVLRRESGTAVLLISHNLPMVARMADRIGVLYAGLLVEEGPAAALLGGPRHPYTERLLRCLPSGGLRKDQGRLETIPGRLPGLGVLPAGCVFEPRCDARRAECKTVAPPVHGPAGHWARCLFDPPFPQAIQDVPVSDGIRAAGNIALRARGLSKTFHIRGEAVRAVRDLSFALGAGETLGLVGESGSGKTTLARMLLGLVPPDPGGTVMMADRVLAPVLRRRGRLDRKTLQIIFQNPDSALNRSQRARTILARPLARLASLRGEALVQRLAALAESVRLSPAQLAARPRALSGGLKQRVAIARAFAGDPAVVICDEPTSALDVSVQAAILNLLTNLQQRDQVSYVFISHDLNVIRFVSDQIAVLYRGRLMEIGPAEAVFAGPNHPYTAMLLASAPNLQGGARGGLRVGGDEIAVPGAGCSFTGRCPRYLGSLCDEVEPELTGEAHLIRCHIPAEALKAGGDEPSPPDPKGPKDSWGG
jgi:peptide/nickel transport system ATP-binding protein